MCLNRMEYGFQHIVSSGFPLSFRDLSVDFPQKKAGQYANNAMHGLTVMSKKYLDELAAWVEKRTEKKRRQDAAVVAFMAVKSDVIDAMVAGYSLTTIWEHMHETGKMKCGYETFRKHVHRFIKMPTLAAKISPDMVSAETPVSAPASPAPGLAFGKDPVVTDSNNGSTKPAPSASAGKISGFSFDAEPNKEELI